MRQHVIPRLPLVLLLALLVGAGLLSYQAHINPSFGWDESLAEEVQGLSVPGFNRFMELVSKPGTYQGSAISYVVLLVPALRWGGWRLAAFVIAVALLELLVVDGTKALVGRPRPSSGPEAEFESFPSGHVLHTMIFFGLVWLMVAPRIRQPRWRTLLAGLFVFMSLLVGLSRVYLERHWPSDCLGSLLIGSLALMGLWAAWRRFMPLEVDRLRSVGTTSE